MKVRLDWTKRLLKWKWLPRKADSVGSDWKGCGFALDQTSSEWSVPEARVEPSGGENVCTASVLWKYSLGLSLQTERYHCRKCSSPYLLRGCLVFYVQRQAVLLAKGRSHLMDISLNIWLRHSLLKNPSLLLISPKLLLGQASMRQTCTFSWSLIWAWKIYTRSNRVSDRNNLNI